MVVLNKSLKLAQHVLKRYEPELNIYYFYNVKNRTFWTCDFSTGSIISLLDGSLSFDEICTIISQNNPQVDMNDIKKSLSDIFDFLCKEGFLVD